MSYLFSLCCSVPIDSIGPQPGGWGPQPKMIAFSLLYLQFLLIKGFEQMLRDNLIEAFLQGQKLSLDAVQETPVDIQPAENETRGISFRSSKVQIHHQDAQLDSVNRLQVNILARMSESCSMCHAVA